MNYGNLTTRIKIHLAQCMETRFAKVCFCKGVCNSHWQAAKRTL